MSARIATKTGRVAAGGSLLVGGVAGALVLAPQAGAATTYHVTNTGDSGAGSLRQAVIDANNNPGADIIVFDTSSAGTITLTTGDISIFDDVTITGLGAADSIISGNNNSRIFYVYGVFSSAVQTVSISGLTMTDGSAVNSGGAIFSRHSDLTLSGVVISGNTAGQTGGGIYSGDAVAYGGAPFTIIDSEISDNTAVGVGGGLNVYQAGNVTITNTVVSGNTSTLGGGANFYYVGNISIVNSSFAENVALSGGGGGFFADEVGDLSIDSSTLDQNTAGEDGGAFYASSTNSLTMTNSTVSGNSAKDGAGLELSENGDVLIANSTIANNVGDSLYGVGGALYSFSPAGDIRIIFSTISGNSTKDNTVMLTGSNSPRTVEIVGTIISDNTTSQGSGDQANDLYLSGSGSFTVSSSLIMGTTAGDPFTDGGGNVNGVSAQLGALANNGGATFTMEPAISSPAINAGPLTWTSFTGEGFDQRATPYVRLYNSQTDIGALEVQPGPTPPSTSTTVVPGDTTTTVGTDPIVPAFTG